MRHSLSFNHSNLMLQAAADGLGVALTGGPLAGDDLGRRQARAALRPDRAADRTPDSYLVAPEATVDRPKVKAFREWILAEVERYKKSPEGQFAALTPV